MSRYLVVTTPFYSHMQPTVAIGRELARRGHEVAWVAYAPMRRLLTGDERFYPLPATMTEAGLLDLARQAGAPFLAGMKVLFESILTPMARDMLPGVEAAIDAFRPDALIVDQQAIAGALAARRRGLPWATSSTSAALYKDHFAEYPQVKLWIDALFASLQRDAGLPVEGWPDRSPMLALLYISRELMGAQAQFPPHYRFIGPVLEARTESADFPWDALRPGRRIFVSLGSIFAYKGERFFRALIDALADAPEQVILHMPAQFDFPTPANFIVRPWMPVLDVLPKVDLLVSHAGTTVLEGLAYGIPAVLTPITQDQQTFTQLAVDFGAARRVTFGRITSAQLGEAVRDVLDEPGYRAAARRAQTSLREAGGAPAAADAIEAMA